MPRDVNSPLSVSLASFALTLVLATAGCSADVNGSGSDLTGPAPSGSADGGSVNSGGNTDSASNGTPAEIAALFEPPVDDTATPDSLPGVWASGKSAGGFNTNLERRLQITKSKLTLALKCEGAISYATVSIRTSANSIAILDAKSGVALSSACMSRSASLAVGQHDLCTDGRSYYDGCIEIKGTTMVGIDMTSSSIFSSDEWLKLSN